MPKKSGETSARGQGRMGPSLAHPLPPMQRKTRGGLSLPSKNFFIFWKTHFAPLSRNNLETLGNLMSPKTEKLDRFKRESLLWTKLKSSEKIGNFDKKLGFSKYFAAQARKTETGFGFLGSDYPLPGVGYFPENFFQILKNFNKLKGVEKLGILKNQDPKIF